MAAPAQGDATAVATTQLDARDSSDRERSSRLLIAGVAAGATVFGTLALTAPFVFMRSPLPYMATPGRKVYRALEHIHKTTTTSRSRGGNYFVDMGSGDGQAVYEALRAGYQLAVGIELNFTLYAIAQLRRFFFWTAEDRARSTFVCGDFFDYNLSDADSVMIFGVNPLMKPLSQKLARECRTGTHILSYRFVLPTADKGDNASLLRASLIYNQEEMHVYRVE